MTAALHDAGWQDEAFEVTVSELLVATADGGDEALEHRITEVLRALRERLKMDVVYCAEFVNGRRVMRQVVSGEDRPVVHVGQSAELEESWCHHVLEGRLPGFLPDATQHPVARLLAPPHPGGVGTHISTPIVLSNGRVYGTLCSFTFSPQDNPDPDDLRLLEMTARLTALRLEGQRPQRR